MYKAIRKGRRMFLVLQPMEERKADKPVIIAKSYFNKPN